MSTLAAAAIPGLASTLDAMKMNAVAREIATDFRYAQMLAVQTGVQHRVSFSTSEQAYAVQRWESGAWALCNHPVTKKPWRPVLTQSTRYAGIRFTNVQFTPSSDSSAVIFDKYGAPNCGGYVTFSLGSMTRNIKVAPLSGRVSVE